VYELARKRCLGARIGSWGKRSSTAGSPLPQPSPESLLASARLDFSASVGINLATQRDLYKLWFSPLHNSQFAAPCCPLSMQHSCFFSSRSAPSNSVRFSLRRRTISFACGRKEGRIPSCCRSPASNPRRARCSPRRRHSSSRHQARQSIRYQTRACQSPRLRTGQCYADGSPS